MTSKIKPLIWIGSAKADIKAFPEDVRLVMGYALFLAQIGGKHPDAKPLHGFGGAGVLEVVEEHDGDCGFRPSRSAIPADADRPFRQGDHRERCAAG